MHYSCIQSVLELIGTHAKDITSFCPSITLSAPEPDDPQDAVVAQQIQFVAIVFVTGYLNTCTYQLGIYGYCSILETTRPLLAKLATGQKLLPRPHRLGSRKR
ncbi:hypothetical protein D5086_030006 [Populus alba]|uniref:Uncharacterized protein n=1 Tax=Populus alba TaxID=43335 RepID=A0ACC4AMB0_POPAL